MSDVPYDLDFLLKAANYSGGPNAPHSDAARKAVDAVAERIRVVAELQLRVAQERLKAKTPEALAAEADAAGLALS
jgi:hypothetical protein